MAEDDTIEEGVLEQLVQKLTPCIERGDLDACVEEAARVANELGIDAAALLGSARQMNIAGKSRYAYVLALGAVDRVDDSGKAKAYYYAGLAAQSLGNAGLAEGQYKKAIAFDPNDATTHYNYALLLEGLGKKDEAAVHYKKAIASDPNYSAAHYNCALLLEDLGKKDEAAVHYKKSIESNPNDVDAHNNYANLLRELRKFNDAEKEVRIALQIAQADTSEQHILPYAHATLGDILADEGYPGYAIKEYEKALNLFEKLHSKDASFISEIHNNLGWAYIQLKSYKKAKYMFRSACALDSRNIKAKRNFRALGRLGIMGFDPILKIQFCLVIVLLILLITSYYMFIITMLSETAFVAQSIFLISMLIFIVLYPQIAKFKFGNIEFEMSTEHRYMDSKNLLLESNFEH